MGNKKDIKFYEKYKPDDRLYISIIVVFSIIRFIPVSCGSLNFDDAINDLAVGCVASTVVAWLIEIANCSKKNKERSEKERMVFAEYVCSVLDLCYLVSRRTIYIANDANSRSFKQWLFILSDLTTYGTENAFEMRKYNYQLVLSHIKRIKSILTTLQQQYALLVQSDIIDTDDLRQHISMGIALCEDIDENLKENDFSDTGIRIANDLLDILVRNVDSFFPNTISKIYSWNDVKG